MPVRIRRSWITMYVLLLLIWERMTRAGAAVSGGSLAQTPHTALVEMRSHDEIAGYSQMLRATECNAEAQRDRYGCTVARWQWQ